MPFAGDFIPPVSPGESQIFAVDFATQIPPGDSIATVSVAISLHSGSDSSVASRLSGAAAKSGTLVTQTVVGLLPGVSYNLIFNVTTASGVVLSNFGRVACLAIT